MAGRYGPIREFLGRPCVMSDVKGRLHRGAIARLAAMGLMGACAAAAMAAPARAQTPTAPAPAAPAPAAPPLPVELNKLEPLTGGAPGCRVYFLVSNPDAEAFDQLRLDLILFANDGVIARRIALDLAPLPPKKTAVRLFDLAGLGCDDIGKMLVNDVISCVHKGVAPTDADRGICLDRLALTSKAKAAVTK
jgi:hypothetical protein